MRKLEPHEIAARRLLAEKLVQDGKTNEVIAKQCKSVFRVGIHNTELAIIRRALGIPNGKDRLVELKQHSIPFSAAKTTPQEAVSMKSMPDVVILHDDLLGVSMKIRAALTALVKMMPTENIKELSVRADGSAQVTLLKVVGVQIDADN